MHSLFLFLVAYFCYCQFPRPRLRSRLLSLFNTPAALIDLHLAAPARVFIGCVAPYHQLDLALMAQRLSEQHGTRRALEVSTGQEWGIAWRRRQWLGIGEIPPATQVQIRPGEFQMIRNCLYFLHFAGQPLVLEVRQEAFQIGHPRGEPGLKAAGALAAEIRALCRKETLYRGYLIAPVRGSQGHNQSQVEILMGGEGATPCLEPELVAQLDASLLRFMHNREELRKLGVPSKRGILLSGPPGTGKTSIVRWLLREAPDYTAVLVRSESLQEIRSCFELARNLAPSMVVIEDIDLLATDRNVSGLAPFLGTLMNEMDGLKVGEDVMVLMTSNDTTQLESAIIRRPGRVDRILEVGLPSANGRLQILRSLILDGQCPNLEKVASETNGLTPACLVELYRTGMALAVHEKRTVCADDLLLGIPGLKKQVADIRCKGPIGIRPLAS